jgi:hypothetical protein
MVGGGAVARAGEKEAAGIIAKAAKGALRDAEKVVADDALKRGESRTAKQVLKDEEGRLVDAAGLADGAGDAEQQSAAFEQKLTDDLAKTNPNYGKGQQWAENCPNCVQAFELRRRGLDVDAAPLVGGAPPTWAKQNWGRDFTDVSQGPDTPRGMIDDAFQQFGPGSRGVVRIRWDNGGGHVFNVENVNGKVRYVCSQTHMDDVRMFFQSGSTVNYVRLDDLPTPDLNGLISQSVTISKP